MEHFSAPFITFTLRRMWCKVSFMLTANFLFLSFYHSSSFDLLIHHPCSFQLHHHILLLRPFVPSSSSSFELVARWTRKKLLCPTLLMYLHPYRFLSFIYFERLLALRFDIVKATREFLKTPSRWKPRAGPMGWISINNTSEASSPSAEHESVFSCDILLWCWIEWKNLWIYFISIVLNLVLTTLTIRDRHNESVQWQKVRL